MWGEYFRNWVENYMGDLLRLLQGHYKQHSFHHEHQWHFAW